MHKTMSRGGGKRTDQHLNRVEQAARWSTRIDNLQIGGLKIGGLNRKTIGRGRAASASAAAETWSELSAHASKSKTRRKPGA